MGIKAESANHSAPGDPAHPCPAPVLVASNSIHPSFYMSVGYEYVLHLILLRHTGIPSELGAKVYCSRVQTC